MKKSTAICGILATMLVIGGCGNKEDKEWSDDLARPGHQGYNNNLLFWYMYNHTFFGNSYYTPMSHYGARPFNGSVFSRTGAPIGSMRSAVPMGSVRGASIGASSFGG